MAIPHDLLTMSSDWASSTRPVLLTFDDGPHVSITPHVLSTLKLYKISAIFFVIGERLIDKHYADILRSVYDQGHLIGNHTWSHRPLVSLGDAEIREEILRTQLLIDSIVPGARLLRPPFGMIDARVREIIVSLGYAPFLWNVDPRDWEDARDSSAWVRAAMQQIASKNESVVLLHDIHLRTSANLPHLIDALSPYVQFPSFFGSPNEGTFVAKPLWSYRMGKRRVW